MPRIDALVVIVGMTTGTGIWCIAVVPLMTLIARHARVSTREGPVVVVKVGWRPGCLSVTVGTVC